MEERLKELKEKINTFVNDYDIENFEVWVETEDISTLGGKHLKANKNARIQINV